MVVNLSYSFIPFQKVSQKGVDRSVENRQKRAENIEMAPNAPNKLSWRMRNKMPLCYVQHDLDTKITIIVRRDHAGYVGT